MLKRAIGTPLARGLALATVVVAVISGVWQYRRAPPGPMFTYMLALVEVPNRSPAEGALWFLPETKSPVAEVGDDGWHYDITSISMTGPHGPFACRDLRTRNLVDPISPHGFDVSGMYFCNGAGASNEELQHHRSVVRSVAWRERWA